MNAAPGAPPGMRQTHTDELTHGERDATLHEVFELHMGMLWLAQHAMRGLIARFELQLPHMMMLHLLDGRHPALATPHQGGLSMSDFVRGMDLPAASATAMIDRMTTQGLVERGPSEQDRRVVLVRLTPRGRQVLDEITGCWQQEHQEAFAVLSDEQLSSHLALIRRVQEGYLHRYPEATRLPVTASTADSGPEPRSLTLLREPS